MEQEGDLESSKSGSSATDGRAVGLQAYLLAGSTESVSEMSQLTDVH